ncbi:hypothetical protein QBC47DRAFT_80983 [Echria macrotheca]|uniref:C2H2-type domain-containing protein n=1 Tax=Echria macrotheca TaxID=438768 RepID=A0AAJ0F1K6_9PEZI|nr:hypothetical protein QBC47DRAFT_80983 [Echria macrotheca]
MMAGMSQPSLQPQVVACGAKRAPKRAKRNADDSADLLQERWKKRLFPGRTGRQEPARPPPALAPPTPTATISSPEQSNTTAGPSGSSTVQSPSSAEQSESWQTAVVPFPSENKELVCVHRRLYYGLHTKIQCPGNAARVWAEDIKKRLALDLVPVQERVLRKNKNAGIELELRMSGTAKSGAPTITLAPTIWILCGSKYCKQKIQKEVAKMTWLRIFRFGIEIHTGTPILAATPEASLVVPLERLDLTHPFNLPSSSSGTSQLLIHLQNDEGLGNTACGRLCCFTLLRDGVAPMQRFSRLGGVMDVGSKDQTSSYGLTAAHALYDLLLSSQTTAEDGNGPVSDDSETDSDCDSIDSNSSCGSHSSGFSAPTDDHKNVLGYRNPCDIKTWVPITSTGPVNFLGRGTPRMQSGSTDWWPELHTSVTNPLFRAHEADFALLTIPTDLKLQNTYGTVMKASISPTEIVDRLPIHSDLDPGEVRILVNPVDSVAGFMLRNTSDIISGSGSIQTRKIELSAPLAKGTSGAWVVGGNQLYGVIIAVYEREPYAHMVTAKKACADIVESLPGFTSAALPFAHNTAGIFKRPISSQEIVPKPREGRIPKNIFEYDKLGDFEDKRLSCPFRKRNPVRFNVRDHQNCAVQSFPDISQLKRHVKIFHKIPPIPRSPCPRCKKNLITHEELKAHLAMPNELCQFRDILPSGDPEDGIDSRIEDALNGRRPNTRIDSWEFLWRTLFPSDEPESIPDQSFVPPIDAEELIVQVQTQSSCDKLKAELKTRLDKARYLDLHEETDALAESLLSVFEHHIGEVLDQYRDSLVDHRERVRRVNHKSSLPPRFKYHKDYRARSDSIAPSLTAGLSTRESSIRGYSPTQGAAPMPYLWEDDAAPMAPGGSVIETGKELREIGSQSDIGKQGLVSTPLHFANPMPRPPTSSLSSFGSSSEPGTTLVSGFEFDTRLLSPYPHGYGSHMPAMHGEGNETAEERHPFGDPWPEERYF